MTTSSAASEENFITMETFSFRCIMTSWKRFCMTGTLLGETTGPRWISLTKGQLCISLIFSLIKVWSSCWQKKKERKNCRVVAYFKSLWRSYCATVTKMIKLTERNPIQTNQGQYDVHLEVCFPRGVETCRGNTVWTRTLRLCSWFLLICFIVIPLWNSCVYLPISIRVTSWRSIIGAVILKDIWVKSG